MMSTDFTLTRPFPASPPLYRGCNKMVENKTRNEREMEATWKRIVVQQRRFKAAMMSPGPNSLPDPDGKGSSGVAESMSQCKLKKASSFASEWSLSVSGEELIPNLLVKM